ncbi:sterol carrier protein 2 [Penicillium longicatenatum]|uniref:sterol carrier protein 2 n=1 Tax=Penicillium longicatenatum TaxID=1561947 RepID=UPI00254898D0|nr:sterol carrier protein 2 [Penicillium longicatenatum]KAJ5651605.1 sterol carrier protein 2 [Penicillium longicatenatum]
MAPQLNNVYILGVGMTKFMKPKSQNDYTEMGLEAGTKALLDAHITYDSVDRAIACYCYGDSTCGQRTFYQFGMTEIPIANVNNNCATGSTGMAMARDYIQHGAADCVMVLGFEKMAPGSLKSNFADRINPLDLVTQMIKEVYPATTKAPFALQMFANAAREYIEKHGATPRDFAEIARVNREHSLKNPYSQFHDAYSLEEIEKSTIVFPPLTKLQCCPTSDGAASAIIVSERFLNTRPHLRSQAIKIVSQALVTDSPQLYSGSAIDVVGYGMAQSAARKAFAEASLSIKDVKAIELHDCFSSNEMLLIDALGLSAPGKAHQYVRDGQLTHGSKSAVINPSGGLLSKGHPLGATGIAQCAELTWQLRGWANNRLIPIESGHIALQHNSGLGGACVVTLLARADGERNTAIDSSEIGHLSGLGYNPATEARGVTFDQLERVRSKQFTDWALKKPKEENSKASL